MNPDKILDAGGTSKTAGQETRWKESPRMVLPATPRAVAVRGVGSRKRGAGIPDALIRPADGVASSRERNVVPGVTAVCGPRHKRRRAGLMHRRCIPASEFQWRVATVYRHSEDGELLVA